MARTIGEQGNGQSEQTVQAEFFQHSGVQHCRRRWRGRVSFRRPGVKWKQRDENSKANKQQQVNMTLRVG